ncbi:MAG: PP2C family protein-serine/threonine phosphatase [Actinomycetes bacterium]
MLAPRAVKPSSLRRPSRLSQAYGHFWRRVLPSQPFQLLAFTGLAVAFGAATLVAPYWVPPTASILVVMLGGFLLRVRSLMLLYLVVAAVLAYVIVNAGDYRPSAGQVIVIGIAALLVLGFAQSRERLGVQGMLGESMLVDLRDRLQAQGRIPPLPRQWHLDAAFRAAYGDVFSGDFFVATRSTDGRTLEMALVDVSGKGQAAGTRALLLSGAFGGLLGSLPQDQFLPAANAYLLRQRWDEGFATAVHLTVDLVTRRFRLASAGHPPAAHFHAGSGRWELVTAGHGPALGIIEDAEFPAYAGVVADGDALLLYTDGMVETPGRDLTLGIDRLMGQAEVLVGRGGLRGGAQRMVDTTGEQENDDRGVVLLWRQ